MSDVAPEVSATPALSTKPVGPDGKPLRPCCVCKDEKKARDICIVEKGEDQCGDLIEAHKACMRGLGFKV